jgi:hypothetical protein
MALADVLAEGGGGGGSVEREKLGGGGEERVGSCVAFAFGVVGESGSLIRRGDTDDAEEDRRGRGGGGIICLSISGDLLQRGASPSVTDIDGPGGSVFALSRRRKVASPFCRCCSSR